MTTIRANELCERTGVSYRQIDHWCRVGIIAPVGQSLPGSGSKRDFDEAIIERVALLGRMSRAFECVIGGDDYKKIYNNYDKGFVDLGHGITLSWRI